MCRDLALLHYMQYNKVSDRLPLLAGDGQRGGGGSVFGFVLVIFLGNMKVTRVWWEEWSKTRTPGIFQREEVVILVLGDGMHKHQKKKKQNTSRWLEPFASGELLLQEQRLELLRMLWKRIFIALFL